MVESRQKNTGGKDLGGIATIPINDLTDAIALIINGKLLSVSMFNP